MRTKRTFEMRVGLLLTVLSVFPVLCSADDSQATQPKKAQSPSVTASPAVDIRLSFKRDPRVVDPYRGIAPWVTAPRFSGATAQDTVEIRVEGLNAAGKPMKVSPEWTASDSKMVTVSPSQGDDVKLTVHDAGECTLKITYQHLTKQLVVKAHKNNFLMFEIAPAAESKPIARPAAEAPGVLKSKGDLSYAAGMSLVKALQEQSVEVDVDDLIQGIKDTLSGVNTRLTEQQALANLAGLYTDQRIVEEGLSRKAVAARNRREGEAFLAENKKKEGVMTLPSGLQYKILKAGEGKKPSSTDVVNVQYRGTFIDGKEFENTLGRGASNLPVDKVIRGWSEALQLMPVGSKWQIFVPSDLAYGERGAGGHGGGKRAGAPRPQIVGPNQTLVFDLELLGIQEADATPPPSDLSAGKKEVTPEMLQELVKAVQAAQTSSETRPEKHEVENQ